MRNLTSLLFAIQFCAIAVAAQSTQPLYDGRGDSQQSVVTKTDEAVFKQQIMPAARRAWASRQKECTDGWEGGPEIRDVTTGSFTKANVMQRAILYNYCTPAHAYAFNGVAIVENGRLIAHLSYQSDWQHAIVAAPDIDGNGLSELILVAGTTNQGTTWSTISLIEVGDRNVKPFGFTEVFSDPCGYDDKSSADGYRVLVKKGSEPQFYREQYKRGCNQRAWRRVKTVLKIDLDDDGVEYRRLK